MRIFVCKLRLHFSDSKHLRGFACHEIFGFFSRHSEIFGLHLPILQTLYLSTRTSCLKTFAERHFDERYFAEKTFCRKDILPNGHFNERTFRKYWSLQGIYKEIKFTRKWQGKIQKLKEIARISVTYTSYKS